MKASELRTRYRRIVGFFAVVTAEFILWEIVLPRLGLNAWSNRTRSARNRRTAQRFRVLAVRMGGLMIKVGQALSTRLDVLPPEITEELAGLQDEVPAEDFSAIRELAERELGTSLEAHFAYFDPTPLAAASLGQAHRATLSVADADEAGFSNVVVKVQRPHIEQVVEVDLAALRRVGGWLQRYKPVAKRANVPALVEEFAATTREEVDYLAEASNAEKFANHFADDARVHVPKVVWEMATRRVLVLEDVSAIKLGDYAAIEAAGISRAEVATTLVDAYLQQIFDDGFFHADPHPGNLFVTPTGQVRDDGTPDWKLTFIDFGMVGRVPENLREGLREAVIAVGSQDGARLVQAFKRLDVLLPGADMRLIERASMQVFERFGGMSMGDLKNVSHDEMMRFGLQFQELIREMPFQLPEDLLFLGRSVAILSGMCTGLDPQFNLWASIGPYATRLVSDEDGSTWDTILAEGSRLLQTAIALPSRADRVLSQIERGELSVQSPVLEMRVRRLERSVGRIASAVVFTGLMVAGAVLYAGEPGIAKVLMAISIVPGVRALMGGRRHPTSG